MKLRWSHAVLYVRDLEAMLAFYRDVLGFQVSDRGPLDPRNPGLEIAFLSQVGSDHHQLAFVPVRGRRADEPARPHGVPRRRARRRQVDRRDAAQPTAAPAASTS